MTTTRTIRFLLVLFCLVGAVCAQAIELSVNAELGFLSAGDHRLGTRFMAELGPDFFDIPEPPHAPSDYLSLSFALPEPGNVFPNRWRADFRPEGVLNDGTEFWELHIESDHFGAMAMVSVDLIEGPWFEIQVFIIGPGGRQRAELPVNFVVPIESGHEIRWIELEYNSPIALENTTWSVLKSLYR